MNEYKSPIPSRVYNAAVNGHVTGADQIIDDKTGLTLDKVAGGALEEKEHISGSNNGMGRVVLRKNIVEGINTLTQDMINKSNTIYIIQYDFTLGENITIPANCVLEFDGGSISGGNGENMNIITGTNTKLSGIKKTFNNIIFAGTFNAIKIDWIDFNNCDLPSFINSYSGSIDLNNQTIECSSNIILHSNIELYNGTINCNNNIITSVGNSNQINITSDLASGDTTIPLDNVNGINEGDYLLIDNGYGSFWTVYENPNRVQALPETIITERAQIVRVKSIEGNSIVIYDGLEFDIPRFPVATNIIENEVLNNAWVLKIGTNININLHDLIINGSVVLRQLLNSKLKNLTVTSNTNKGIVILYSINVSVEDCTSYAYSCALELSYYNYRCKIDNCKFYSYQNSDATVLFMYHSYDNIIQNCSISGNTNYTKSGLYFNSCRKNKAFNIDIINSYYGVQVAYDLGEHIVEHINVTNSTCAIRLDNTKNCKFKNFTLKNIKNVANVSNGIEIRNAYNIIFENINLYGGGESNITNAFGIEIYDSNIYGFQLLSENTTYLTDKFAIKIKDCIISGTTYIRDGDSTSPFTGIRNKYYENCLFKSPDFNVYLGDTKYTNNNFFRSCTFKSNNSYAFCAGAGNNSFIDCTFEGNKDINNCDFNINVSSATGGEFVGSSAQYFENCIFVNNKHSSFTPFYAFFAYAIPWYFILGRKYSSIDENGNTQHFVKTDTDKLKPILEIPNKDVVDGYLSTSIQKESRKNVLAWNNNTSKLEYYDGSNWKVLSVEANS